MTSYIWRARHVMDLLGRDFLAGRRPQRIVSEISSVKNCLLRLQCCNHNEVETFGHLTNDSTPVFACKFHPNSLDGHLLVTADEEGSLVARDCRRSLDSEDAWLVGIGAHKNAVFDLEWVPGGNQLISASADHTLKHWDMMTLKCMTVMQWHNASVKSVDVCSIQPSVLASGGRDGILNLWDLRYSPKTWGHHRPVCCIEGPHSTASSSSSSSSYVRGGQRKRKKMGNLVYSYPSKDVHGSKVTAVKFVGEHYLASAGTCDGKINVWDRRKLSSIHQGRAPVYTLQPEREGLRTPGFTSLVRDTYHSRLYATATDSRVYGFDTLSFNRQPSCVLSGHSCQSYFVKAAISPDNRFLLSGSTSADAYIWDLQAPSSRPFVLTGHTKEVTCVAWSSTMLDCLATCSDDNTLRLWKPTTAAGRCDTLTPCTSIGRSQVAGPASGGRTVAEEAGKENTPPASQEEGGTSDPFSTPTSARRPNVVQKSLHSYFGLPR